MTASNIRPRDIVTPASLRNALTVTAAMGGSTNVMLHSVEIARAAGIDLWSEVLSQAEFNDLSRRLPVLVNMRPFGFYSMPDIEAKGGIPVIVKDLLDAGFLDGTPMTCTGETLADQIERLAPPLPDHDVIYSVARPFKELVDFVFSRAIWRPMASDLETRWRRRWISDDVFIGRARVFNSERSLTQALDQRPEEFQDGDMVVIRYEGPAALRGCPKCLNPRRRSPLSVAKRASPIGLMTDARFSGGSVGNRRRPCCSRGISGGAPIALVEDGDTITVNIETDRIDCLHSVTTRHSRSALRNGR